MPNVCHELPQPADRHATIFCIVIEIIRNLIVQLLGEIYGKRYL